MKGLFNYETAFREYTKQCLQEFTRDNIQYAEIRVNFMQTNQVWLDDGSGQIDNEGIMDIIIEEYERFKTTTSKFYGLKVIYCTPRSFSEDAVAEALDECTRFKRKYPQYIAGLYDCFIVAFHNTKSQQDTTLWARKPQGNHLSHSLANSLASRRSARMRAYRSLFSSTAARR